MSDQRKLYYLSSCSTCKKIMNGLGEKLAGFEIQDIKARPISAEQVDEMKALSGSYESLFSRRAQKYKLMDLANKELKEEDYRSLIIEEYTFLKRPVFIVDGEIFVGNSPKVIEELETYLS